MKHLLWLLAVLGVTASPASAGPNLGGVLWVHDTGIAYSSDIAQPVVSTPPADCAGVDNQQPLDGVKRVWKVYAAFPPGSSPRLKSTAWGIQFPESPSDPYVSIEHAGCGLPNEDGPNTDFAFEDHGFPTSSGGEIGQSFPNARLTTVVELYCFAGFGLSYPGAGLPDSFQTVPHSAPSDRFFLDDATPQNADMIVGYGSLGFGRAGTTPCPTTDFNAACCTPDGLCTLTTQGDCLSPGIWYPEWISCLPNPCPPATGACCYPDGTCQVTPCDPPVPGDPCPGGMTAQRCEYTGGTYQGDLVECYPNPCPLRAACCVPDGYCFILTQAACEARNPPGIWHPESPYCDNNPCLQIPTAACCPPTGSCAVTTQAACPSPNIWHEEWASCAPNPCPPPAPSACCAPTGACTVTTEQDCPAPNVWHSTWPTCNPGPCLAPGAGSIVGWGTQVVVEPSALEGIVAVAAGGYHSAGVKSDGTIVAWGQNSEGQCNLPSPNSGFLTVAGWYHSLGLKSDRTLVAWGENTYGQCDVPSPNADFVAAAGGRWHSLGLRSGGSIVAWGSNDFGQCNVPTPNAGFVAVAAGDMHSLGLKSDGTIAAWGFDFFHQCGVPTPNTDFVAVAAGEMHSLGLKSDGSIVAWGDNDQGQCNVPSPNDGFVAVAGGFAHSLGLRSDGSIVAWGDNDQGQCDVPSPNAGFVAIAGGIAHSLGLKSDGSIVAWGDNSDAQCGIPAPDPGFVAVAGGFAHSLGLRSDRTIAAWGNNSDGECDVPAPNADFAAVAAGLKHSLGLTSEGSIVAWGSNICGECTVPSPNADFVAVAAGHSYSLGLKSDRTIEVWGLNPSGLFDVPAPNADFVAVAASIECNNLGLKSDGTIVAWGDTSHGQGSVPAPNAGFVAVASGWYHSLGLKFDGTIVAWGWNGSGQCDVPSPNADFVAVAAGRSHSLGLKSNGSVVAWGDDGDGECNVPLPNAGFVAIAGGWLHVLGLRGTAAVSGACCTPAGDCTLTFQADCPSPNIWQGAGTSCIPNPCSPTPVLLESWATSSLAEGLQIRWEVPLGTSGARYRAWRDPAAGPRDLVPTPEATLVSPAWIRASAEGIVEVVDLGALPGSTVRYFLERSADGTRSEFLGPLEARWGPPATVWSVGPTPFRGRLRLTPPGPGPARAEIFDPAGRLIQTLERTVGSTPLEWDGLDASGRNAPTGVYLARLRNASGAAVERLVKIQ